MQKPGSIQARTAPQPTEATAVGSDWAPDKGTARETQGGRDLHTCLERNGSGCVRVCVYVCVFSLLIHVCSA